MKLLAYLKIALKGIIKEFPAFILNYAIFPIIIALIVGYVQQDMFTPVINDPIFSIVILDEDNSNMSNNLISFLNNDEISKIITVKPINSEKFDYTLRIPVGYENSLYSKEMATVKVEAEEDSPTSLGNILVNIVDNYNNEVSQRFVIQNSIENNSKLKVEKENLILDINTIVNKAYSTDLFKTNIHNVKKSLNSYEYFSISFLSYIFIMFIIAIIMSDTMEKEIGLYSRIMSTSMTKFQYSNYNFMSNYLMMIVTNILYISGYRLSGLSFKGSLPILLLIALIQSLIITTIGSLISTLFKKKYGLPLMQMFLIFQVILGGMIGPLEKLRGNKILIFFAKYKPDILISNTYRNYILNNSLSSISNYLLIMIGISIVIYLINILCIQMEWGVKE